MTDANDRSRRDQTAAVRTDGGHDYEADEDESFSEAVIRSVSAVRGVDPTELPPLYDTIDPDGLDELFGPTVQGKSRSGARVQFTYAGCEVTVFSSGRVLIERPE